MIEVKIRAKAKQSNQFDVTMKGFTAGMILAMKNALVTHSATSPVAKDVLDFLNKAVEENPDLKARVG